MSAAAIAEKPIPIRLPVSILQRADALIPKVEFLPEFTLAARVSRAAVLRLALLRGLAMLEAETSTKRRK